MQEIKNLLKTNQNTESTCDLETYYNEKVKSENDSDGTLDDGYNCPICKNKGYIAYVKNQGGYFYEYQKECTCQTVRREVRRLKFSGLQNPESYSFDNYQVTDRWQGYVKERAEAYIKESGEAWFFIGGQSGAGKTHICTAISVAFIKERKRRVHYMLWRDEVTKLKSIVMDNPEEYEDSLNKLKTVDVLYIDDLFKTGRGEPPTKADVNLAFEVLNFRYNAKLPTIISSEYTLNEIIDIDEAIGGRISERTEKNYLLSIGKDRKKNYRLRGVLEL